MTATDAYAELVRRAKEIALIQSCSAVLGWDQQTYMPKQGAGLRGEQLAYLAGLSHAKATDRVIGDLLSQLEGSDLLDDPDAVITSNVRELRQSFDRQTKIPSRLVEELARVTTAAQEAWQEARATQQFARFQPHLEKIVALKREEAQAVGYRDHPYDALLDEYEPGATAAEVKEVFAGLTKELVPMIAGIRQSGRTPRTDFLRREYAVDRQRWFAEGVASAVGFDFASGRLDTTTHPFCSGFGPGDCRLTTRYNPRFFPEAFFGVLHETGHGLYEQGLDASQFGLPAGTACSLGIHESQSRFWENQVGRSELLWKAYYPRLQQAFPGTLTDITPEEFLAGINEVRPSFIRVEADEVTYNLHVALRFELELALLDGQLRVADLPLAWNDRFHALMGLRPGNDAEGCLQDIHWSFGGLGYFPTYTLGNLYAAQFMEGVKSSLGEQLLTQECSAGNYRPILEWLREQIHRHGRRYRAQRLCRLATGKDLTAGPFLRYLREKLSRFYPVC